MTVFIQDLKFAMRGFARTPVFTLTAIITLALGIGANTAIFSVINTVLLKPLPYGNPDRVVTIWSRWNVFPKTWVSIAEYQLYRKAESFQQIGIFGTGFGINLTGGEEPERVNAVIVSPNLFGVLRAPPMLGRTFTIDDVRQQSDVVILSYELWRRRFGEDASVVGSTTEIDGKAQTVVGVMPPDFRLHVDFNTDQRADVWAPGFDVTDGPVTFPRGGGSHSFYVAARLKDGATVETAHAELETLLQPFRDDGVYPEAMKFEPLVFSARADVLGKVRPALLVLMGAVGLVLLITCANVANLLLSKTNARQRELAIRTAVGAGRGRLIRQLLTESLTLTMLGGALGVATAFLGLKMLFAYDPGNLPRISGVALDLPTLIFTGGVALLTAPLLGLIPALRGSRTDLTRALREGVRGGTGADHHRTQGILVAVEMAFTVVLLVGSGLMLKTVTHLLNVDLGFKSDNVVTMRITAPSAFYPKADDVTRFYEQLITNVGTIPGVEHASAVRILPLATQIGDWGTRVEGYIPQPGENTQADWQVAMPGYFEAMGIPLISGRRFTGQDRTDGRQVMIINQAMADAYWPGGDPIGKRVWVGGRTADSARLWTTIVGVAGNVTHNGITAEIKRKWYRPHSQFHRSAFLVRTMTLVIKTTGDPLPMVPRIKQRIARLDSRLSISGVKTLEDVLSDSIAQSRFLMLLLSTFAGLALVLAVVGAYGVLSYAVSQRTREIGIRVALGAGRGEVVKLTVRSGMQMAGLGIAAGAIAALGLSGVMASQLYEVGARDPLTFVSVIVLFSLVALAACYIPARRAAAVDPANALRVDG